jgi:DNA-binding FrmR family transcriptional regulator
MAHVTSDKKKLLSRIRRIKGQLTALENSLENDVECFAVLQQIAAVRGASNGLMKDMLDNHIKEHLGSDDISSKKRAEEISKVSKLLKSYLK